MQYYRPNSLEEYFNVIDSQTLYAGGTDLIPRYERGEILPQSIIDLKRLPELQGIQEIQNSLEIGAAVTIEEIKNSELLTSKYQALQESSIDFGSVQIRNRATIGGNICNASPAGDTLSPLYAFDAKLLLTNKNGHRLINIEDFIFGPGKINLEEGELLQKILIPKTKTKSVFYKLGLREAMAISVINFAIVHDKNELTIAVGAVAPTVLKFSGLTGLTIEDIISGIDQTISPIDDIRGTADYRRKVLRNMLAYELSKIID